MESLDTVKSKITELFGQMGFDVQIFERQEEGRTVLNLKTSDAQILIGKQGANLEALQHVIRLLVRNQEIPPFAIDIDDYKEKRGVYLKEIARKAAAQARSSHRAVALFPMSAQERRIVHNYLSLFADLTSQSQGVDPNRRIVIRINKKSPKDDFNFIENM